MPLHSAPRARLVLAQAGGSRPHWYCSEARMRAAADIILSVENLSKAFQGVQALAPLSFTIGYGITAFIGPNGAGKTTLFNLLSGIYGPSSGSISHRGEDITALPVAERAQRGIQRTFQNLQIFFRMSALENVMVGASPRLRLALLPSLLNAPSVRRESSE